MQPCSRCSNLQPLPRDLKDAADLLERIAEQDVDGGDGQIKMKRGVAKDKVISVTDPDMHHRHETSSFKVDGYKFHIMTDANFVTSVVVTPANKADAEPSPDVVDQCEENGVKFKKVMGDSAYSNWPIVEEKVKDGITVIAKVPSEPVVDGRYPKSKFEIDTESGVVTCPEGFMAQSDSSAIRLRKRIFVSFSSCMECSSKTECTSSPKGRRISIHPYEPEVAAERKRQATPEFKELYSEHANSERIISCLTRHGGRQAKYIRIFKVWCQEVLTAFNHNVKALCRLAPAIG
jgi:hypothetical protein